MKHLLSAPLLLAIALSGCAVDRPQPASTPEPSASATPSASPTPSVSPTPTPSSTPTPSATPTPTPKPQRAAINGWKNNSLDLGSGTIQIAVQVQEGLAEDPDQFGKRVITTLNDPRGWAGLGKTFHLTPDASSAGIVVHLAKPAMVDKMCAPLQTAGYVSCSQGATVWLNVNRWREAVPHIKDLETYRTYVISHEVGHSLGRGHVNCPGPGKPAPVMQQQTYGLQGCIANGWITVG